MSVSDPSPPGIQRRLWGLWALVCAVIFAVHALTLRIDPLLSQDEIQIVDFGRQLLAASSDWALTWYVQGGHPILLISWPGVLLQELAYRLTAPDFLGTRLLTTLAAVLAATALLGWLRARGTPAIVALILAAAFLLDPAFSHIYRGGRIDGWTLGACLAACWLLRQCVNDRTSDRPIRGRVALAGALTVAAFFFWPTAPALYPLIGLELIGLALAVTRDGRPARSFAWVAAFSWFAAGASVALLIFSVPVLLDWEVFWSSTLASYELQKVAAGVQNPVVGLLLTYDPVLFLVTLLALLIRRDWGLLAALGLALLMIHQTPVYLARIIYLIPYGIAMIAWAWSGPQPLKMPGLLGAARSVALVALIGVHAVQVMVARPVHAFARQPANDPDQFLPVLATTVGAGPCRVLLKEWEAYYAGRELGWRMLVASNPTGYPEYSRFVGSMDHALLRSSADSGATIRALNEHGFERIGRFEPARPAQRELDLGGYRVLVNQATYPEINLFRHPRGGSERAQAGSPGRPDCSRP